MNMQKTSLVLGIDTSNYKTSAALVDINGRTLADSRKLLNVKTGERGLRQSEALFQHVENLPGILENVYKTKGDIKAVCVSVKPRPVNGSYMPCFNAGRTVANAVAGALGVPCFETSHQEGHIAAIEGSLEEEIPCNFLSLHLSGGTCELLNVHKTNSGYNIEIIGGSKDISFGQVIDRIGVSLGMEFPAGALMDEIAVNATDLTYKPLLSGIKVSDSYFNLSGLETQAQRVLDSTEKDCLVLELFDRISSCIEKMVEQAVVKTDLSTVIFAGGVSSSIYISRKLLSFSKEKGYNFHFGDQSLSSDNAVGVARIGARLLSL